jgi:enoyl-CoA hydratase/carnithine racemase
MATLVTGNSAPPPCRAADAELVVEREGAVVRLRLNRSWRGNALKASLVDRLIDAIEDASPTDTRLLVIEGGGANFCSGFDLGGIEDLSDGDLALRFLGVELLLQKVYHAPMRTIAFAQGRAFGAGADLFCACSVRIAAPSA